MSYLHIYPFLQGLEFSEEVPGIKEYVLEIGKDFAEAILEKNTKNRDVNKKQLNYIARQFMLKGKWKYNAHPMIIADTGALLDGQHRLLASLMICKDDPSFTFITKFVVGMKEEMFATIDTNKARTANDVLAAEGFKNSNILGGAVNFLNMYSNENGQFDWNCKVRGFKTDSEDVLGFVKNYGIIQEYAEYVAKYNKKGDRKIQPKTVLGFYYFFKQINSDKADDFVMQLCTGIGLTETNPILTLRNKIAQVKATGAGLLYTHLCAYMVETWNAYEAEKPLKRFEYQARKDFPILNYQGSMALKPRETPKELELS